MSINKELFIEDLKSKYTLLQEVNYLIKNVIKLIDELNSADSIKNEIVPYINELKQYVTQNGNTTEIGGNLVMNGGGSISGDSASFHTMNVATKLNLSGTKKITYDDTYEYTFQDKSGTVALLSDIPSVGDYLRKSGGIMTGDIIFDKNKAKGIRVASYNTSGKEQLNQVILTSDTIQTIVGNKQQDNVKLLGSDAPVWNDGRNEHTILTSKGGTINGNLSVGGNLEVDGDLLLNNASNLKTKDGSSLTVSGTKLYTHLIKIENGDNNETYTFIVDSTHDKIITSLKEFRNNILKYVSGSSKYGYVINGLCVKNNVSHVCIAYPSESAYVKLNIQPVDSSDSFTYVDLNINSNLTFTSSVIPLF